MQLNTVLYFIAGRVASEIEKAAIAELRTTAKNVTVLCAKYIDTKYHKADAVAGSVPDAYSDHGVIITEAEREAKSFSDIIEDAVIDTATAIIDEIGDAVEATVEAALSWATEETPNENPPSEPATQVSLAEGLQAVSNAAWGAPAPDGWGASVAPAFPVPPVVAAPMPTAPEQPATGGARKPRRGRR